MVNRYDFDNLGELQLYKDGYWVKYRKFNQLEEEITQLKLKLRQLEVAFTNYRLRDNEGFVKLKEENKRLKAELDYERPSV